MRLKEEEPRCRCRSQVPSLRDGRAARPHVAGVRDQRSPIWCSTDLRDGNQALVNPMDAGRKRRFFDLLVQLGIKEIEVGFRPRRRPTSTSSAPSSSRPGPADTTIAVLTQARPELIERTYEAIDGARRAIIHLYNSTSVTQRRVVFRLDREGITELAVRGTRLCSELAAATAPRSSSSTRPRASITRSSTTRSRSARPWRRSGGRRRARR